jgi:hypothetical protein
MAKQSTAPQSDDLVEVDLRNPGLAAFLAWLWPGAGHLYQGRYAKGILFMVVVLGMFSFGLLIGEGRVVYASWTPTDRRWQYLCQLGVGLPALPALIQARRVFWAPPHPPDPMQFEAPPDPRLWNGFMAPPEQPVKPEQPDELAEWHLRMSHRFELGTLYTMIAGLLNVLAIYDAYAGPFGATEEEDPEDEQAKKGGD